MKHIYPIITLACIVLILFSNTIKNPFMWDDHKLITKNSYIKTVKNIPFFFAPQYWNTNHPFHSTGQYRPVRTASFAIDYAVWGLNPAGFHITNIIIHLFNVILIYIFVGNLIQIKRHEQTNPRANDSFKFLMSIPFLTALAFASHPIHTESVTWIKNRSDLLALFFFLLSFISFSNMIFQKKPRALITYSAISLACYTFSLLSKIMAITLPVVFICFILCFISKSRFRKGLLKVLPFILITALFVSFKLTQLHTIPTGVEAHSIGLYSNVLFVFKTYGYYFKLLVFPIGLTIEHLIGTPKSLLEPSLLLSMASLLAIVIITFKSYRYSRLLSFSFIWLIITLIPVANIIYLSSRPIAEQRLYIPSFGFCLMLALGMHKLITLKAKLIFPKLYKSFSIILILLIFFSYSAITISRNLDWRDPLTFWSKAVESSPKSGRVQYNLANTYGIMKMFDKAIPHYFKAIEISPDYTDSYYNLGLAFAKMNKHDKAIMYFSEAIKRNAEYTEAYNNMGVVYAKLRRFEEAEYHFLEALRIDPSNANAYYNLGMAYDKQGREEEAIFNYNKALKINADFFEAYHKLGVIFAKKRDFKKAVAHFAAGLKVEPHNPKIHCNLGKAFVQLGSYERAVNHFSEALRIRPDYLEAHYYMGHVYLKIGNLKKAQFHFKKTIQIKSDFAEGYNNLGYTLALKGEMEEAVKLFSRALLIRPNYPAARKNLEIGLRKTGKDRKTGKLE